MRPASRNRRPRWMGSPIGSPGTVDCRGRRSLITSEVIGIGITRAPDGASRVL
jgi:hypothetical protein